MTTQTPSPISAARENARRPDGKFGTQPLDEAQLELFPAPVDQLRAPLAKAPSAFGAQVSDDAVEFLPGPQLQAAIAALRGTRPETVTGIWTTRPDRTGGRLDVSLSAEAAPTITKLAPNAAAAVSELTADLDRRAGLPVPYRRDDLIVDDVAIDVAFGVSPLAYSSDLTSNAQRDIAADAYRQAHGAHIDKIRTGWKTTPSGLDAAARGCYTDALSTSMSDPATAAALAEPDHLEHDSARAETWGRCAAAAHFLTRGKGDSSKMADTLYTSVLNGHDAEEAWSQVVAYHGEHNQPAFNNTGGCTNRPGEKQPKPSLLSRLRSR